MMHGQLNPETLFFQKSPRDDKEPARIRDFQATSARRHTTLVNPVAFPSSASKSERNPSPLQSQQLTRNSVKVSRLQRLDMSAGTKTSNPIEEDANE